MNESARILSTKKLLPNQRQFLLNADLAVIEADFIEINYTRPDLININENLIFTSSNAIRSIIGQKEMLIDKPCYCVGLKAKELLENKGFKVKGTANNAEALGGIIEETRNESFTFFTGNLRLDILPEILRNAGIELNEIEVYKTVLSPQQIKAKCDGIMFFSPSGVESFLKENKVTDEICFCIGNTTAKALESITDKIITASQPTIENVIIKTINQFKKA